MGKSINNKMPMAKCPHCWKEIQIDDWYDFKGGEEVHCSECGKVMYVLDAEACMYVTLGTKSD